VCNPTGDVRNNFSSLGYKSRWVDLLVVTRWKKRGFRAKRAAKPERARETQSHLITLFANRELQTMDLSMAGPSALSGPVMKETKLLRHV